MDQRDYHYGIAPQGILGLRLIFGDRAMFDLTGRGYYLTGTGGEDPGGTETIGRLNMVFTVRVYGRHALGIQYVASSRDAQYPDQPDSHQTVGTFSLVYGAEIDDQFIEHIFHASPMHDIGKVAVPDHILLKPGKLTDEEFVTVKRHSVLGAEALEAVYNQYPNPLVKIGMELARSHHERWDGTGYPATLMGEEIPLSGRITMLADQYDALRTARPYKPALDDATTFAIITVGDGRTMPYHFDPRMLVAFLTLREEFRRIHDEFQG